MGFPWSGLCIGCHELSWAWVVLGMGWERSRLASAWAVLASPSLGTGWAGHGLVWDGLARTSSGLCVCCPRHVVALPGMAWAWAGLGMWCPVNGLAWACSDLGFGWLGHRVARDAGLSMGINWAGNGLSWA
jgi:hypothetical protein